MVADGDGLQHRNKALAVALQPAAPCLDLGSVPANIACCMLQVCGWKQRAALAALNRHWRNHVFGQECTWKLLCARLHREELVYSAPVCTSSSWRALFFELWPKRTRWAQPLPPTEEEQAKNKVCRTVAELLAREKAGETGLSVEPAWKQAPAADAAADFHISVHVRLRPRREGGANDAPDGNTASDARPSVVLPLHQRLAMVKSQKGCSTAQAFAEIFGSSDGDFFAGATVDEGGDASNVSEKANVENGAAPAATPVLVDAHAAATTDTTSKKHAVEPAEVSAGVVSAAAQEIVMCAPGVGLRPFTCFNTVLSETASQAAVYETVARAEITAFVNGLNCTIFCYGQVGFDPRFDPRFDPTQRSQCFRCEY